MENPKISIITVSYNAAKTIEQTILSVVEQTYENIEYIIIDGGSTDGTVDIIMKHAYRITYWMSEPDEGIYDAMNKGMEKASGDLIFFLNSDDIFCSDAVLEEVEQQISHIGKANISIVMGNIVSTYNGKILGIIQPLKKIDAWYTPPHQAIFLAKNLYKSFLYRQEFKILGDRELWLRLNKANLYHVQIIDCDIAYYE